ncbi:MAG TPA: hypothetical protein VE988_28595 [Gemmataceae bacterium]|nr:hypothetical protein [Gemmataceae bacterium]
MRKSFLLAITLIASLAVPGAADAQQTVRRFKLDYQDIQVGFPNVTFSPDMKASKVGLWTPVLLKFSEDPEGKIVLPVAVDGSVSGEVLLEAPDNDGAISVYSQKFSFGPSELVHVLTYTKVASSYSQFSIKIKAGNREFGVQPRSYQAAESGHHIYLALGDSLRGLHDGLRRFDNQGGEQVGLDNTYRHLVYENDVRYLPDQWFGYNSIDLVILVTSNERLLTKLTAGDQQSTPQLAALAEWVRRGGRLVISISPNHREKVHRLLASSAWQPALPAVLPLDSKTFTMPALDSLRTWSAYIPSGGKGKLGAKAVEGVAVRLLDPPTVAVLAKETVEGKDTAPLIVRFPHGTGSITLLAFDVKDTFLSDWDGKHSFWRETARKLAPRSTRNQGNQNDGGFQNFGGQGADVTSNLYDQLENFDTPTISFGWVVLFIFIYILVVGPLDFIILKLVFKRLELTWLTFPAVVLTVSLLAYFTAYAIKGQDLKVNKVDLIDIDMRSSLGDDYQPNAATAYGNTWFAIFSPRIQNYTIGIEPTLHLWQPGTPAPNQPVEPTMSWLGRPDYGPYGGRRGNSGFLNRNYSYESNATGLRGVPIPVWTMKSFTASWAASFDKNKLPLESKLTYTGKLSAISGSIKNNLPFDLHEVAFFYRGQYHPQTDIPKGATATIKLEVGRQVADWVNLNSLGLVAMHQWDPDSSRRQNGYFNPKETLRAMMFFEKLDTNFSYRNQSHRPLDWSWRLDEQTENGRVADIILVARVGRAQAALEQLQADNDVKLPTHLWLDKLPGTPVPGKTKTITRPDGKTETVPVFESRPAIQGNLIQETYLRVILPVAPKK